MSRCKSGRFAAMTTCNGGLASSRSGPQPHMSAAVAVRFCSAEPGFAWWSHPRDARVTSKEDLIEGGLHGPRCTVAVLLPAKKGRPERDVVRGDRYSQECVADGGVRSWLWGGG